MSRHILLEIKTEPEGAIVYLIPKIIWDRNPNILNTNYTKLLEKFRCYEGYTPLSLIVEEYVYVIVLKNDKNGKYKTAICKPKYKNRIEKVFLKMNE